MCVASYFRDDLDISAVEVTRAVIETMGCRVRILSHTVLGEERHLDWSEALQVRLDCQNPWYRKYFEFAEALVRVSAGSFPVSHAAEPGPTDLPAVLRSPTQSVWDLADEPEKSHQLLESTGEIFQALTEEIVEAAAAVSGRRLLMDSRDPRGLFLNLMVRHRKEVEALRPLVGM